MDCQARSFVRLASGYNIEFEEHESKRTYSTELCDDPWVEEERISCSSTRGGRYDLPLLHIVLNRDTRRRQSTEEDKGLSSALRLAVGCKERVRGVDVRRNLHAHDDPTSPKPQPITLDELPSPPGRRQRSTEHVAQVSLFARRDEPMQDAQHRQRVRDDRVVVFDTAPQ